LSSICRITVQVGYQQKSIFTTSGLFLKIMIHTDTRKLGLFNATKTVKNGRRILAQLQVLFCRYQERGSCVFVRIAPFPKIMISNNTSKLAYFNATKTAKNGQRVLAQLQVLFCRYQEREVLYLCEYCAIF
jgi:hypothetical protein